MRFENQIIRTIGDETRSLASVIETKFNEAYEFSLVQKVLIEWLLQFDYWIAQNGGYFYIVKKGEQSEPFNSYHEALQVLLEKIYKKKETTGEEEL